MPFVFTFSPSGIPQSLVRFPADLTGSNAPKRKIDNAVRVPDESHSNDKEMSDEHPLKRRLRSADKLTLNDLPDCLLRQILECLSYEQIAKSRQVCVRFNEVAGSLLNAGFWRMISNQQKVTRRIKAILPRRESERRSHPLSRYVDVLACLETRISMLTMTYTRYIDADMCCFIPGQIIDEVNRILRLLGPPEREPYRELRVHEVLQELRDISSMAIDHFDEHVMPALRKKIYTIPNALLGTGSGLCMPASDQSGAPDIPSVRVRRNQEFTRLHKLVQELSAAAVNLRTLNAEQAKTIKVHAQQIAELQQIVQKHYGSNATVGRQAEDGNEAGRSKRKKLE